MARLVVTNLPTKISQEDIKKHFTKKGNVTDVKLVYKDGVFRRYCFVGYEKEEDAKEACSYFNDTYIKQAKVTVNICEDYSDGHKPKSWREKNELKKKAAKEALEIDRSDEPVNDKKKKKKSKKTQETSNILKEYENDPEFNEFLKASSKGVEKENVRNQVSSVDPTSPSKETEKYDDEEEEEEKEDEDATSEKLADKKEVSDLDYLKSLKISSKSEDSNGVQEFQQPPKVLKELYQVVIRTKEKCKIRQKGSMTFTKQSVKDFLKPLKCTSLRVPPKLKFVAYVGFKTEKDRKKALQKHKSFLNGARVQVIKYEKAVEPSDPRARDAPWQASEEKLKQSEAVAESGKLFVRNLWYSVTESDLRELFEEYGEITDITLPICKLTRRPKGFATITFMLPEHSVRAMNELDRKSFKGRLLHILPARTEEEESKLHREGESFKEKKEREQKATSGSWHNWNSLFLGSGAVIDIMAEKYNKSKQEILFAEGKQSVAVNLALGESQIVDETKRFLEENGIALDAFTSPGVQRSNTVILVKNLPANTKAQEISRIFSKYGELGRVILPPAGVSGVVEYLDPGEAKKGFRSLAYSKFGYLPLYLEWAPQRVFKTEFVPGMKENKNTNSIAFDIAAANLQGNTISAIDKEEETSNSKGGKTESLPDPEPETTLYVKNLNFNTNEEMIKEHFSEIGPVHTVLIAKKRTLSLGYGFVQFVYQAHAQKALREMQETLLDEKYLLLKLSEKTLVTTTKTARMMHDRGEPQSSKILVKNIPFEATSREIRQLFSTFGELKTVRLPNKPGNTEHRGFGFVDFISKEEAKKAFEALGMSTHLYGRRLVLEWAKSDESVDELRQRTAEQFISGRGRGGPPLKKQRLTDALESGEHSDDD